MTFFQKIIFIILIFSLVGCQQSSITGLSTLSPVDAQKAYRKNLVSAENGDVAAVHTLGMMKLEGIGVEQNTTEAVNWLIKASDAGNYNSQYTLAEIYEKIRNLEDIDADYKKAFNYLNQAAKQGYVKAQYMLGDIYAGRYFEFYDWGIQSDRYKAFDWFTKAAEQGNSNALIRLAIMYKEGKAITRDYKKTFNLLSQAAKSNNSDAQFNIGILYLNGIGVEKNLTQALAWMNKAANNNSSAAQKFLVNMYTELGGENKYAYRAIEWLKMLSENDHYTAQIMLGWYYKMGIGTVKRTDLSKEEFIKAARIYDEKEYPVYDTIIVREPELEIEYYWLRNAMFEIANSGNPEAQYLYAMKRRDLSIRQMRLYEGRVMAERAARGVDIVIEDEFTMFGWPDPAGPKYVWLYISKLNGYESASKALEYLEKQYEDSHRPIFLDRDDVQMMLGEKYLEGTAIDQDYELAFDYFTKAYAQGKNRSGIKLGYLYENGLGVSKDVDKAIELYLEATKEVNDDEALRRLGNLYEKGIYVEQDFQKAKDYYVQGALNEDYQSFIALYNMYLNGIGVRHDKQKAYTYILAVQKAILRYSDGPLPDDLIDIQRNMRRDFSKTELVELEKAADNWEGQCRREDIC